MAILAVPGAVSAQGLRLGIRGTVTDSVRGAPLEDATVVATRTAQPGDQGAPRVFTDVTDAAGHFSISGLVPAVYMVTVEHQWLDSTGFDVPPVTVDLRNQREATLQLAVPSGRTIVAAFCPTIARDTTVGLVEGHVNDALSGRPLVQARVLFEWNDFDVNLRTGRALPRRRAVSASTAQDGSYAVCGIPIAAPVMMQAQVAGRPVTGAVEVSLPTSGVLIEPLRADTGRTGSATVTGRVTRGATAAPLAGAHVHLFGADGEVTTGADGSFRLTRVPYGTQSIEVTSVGFRPHRFALDVGAEQVKPVSIAMSEMGTLLDSVRTVAKMPHAAAMRDEFDHRIKSGTGQYLTQDAIERLNPLHTTDLIRAVHGFKLQGDTVFSSRGEYELGGTNMCMPTVLIDGNRADTMNEVDPVAIHGIEAYASDINVPPQFIGYLKHTSSSCGLIMIWTK